MIWSCGCETVDETIAIIDAYGLSFSARAQCPGTGTKSGRGLTCISLCSEYCRTTTIHKIKISWTNVVPPVSIACSCMAFCVTPPPISSSLIGEKSGNIVPTPSIPDDPMTPWPDTSIGLSDLEESLDVCDIGVPCSRWDAFVMGDMLGLDKALALDDPLVRDRFGPSLFDKGLEVTFVKWKFQTKSNNNTLNIYTN